MSEGIRNFITGTLAIIFMVCVFIGFVYWISAVSNHECLEDIAKEYCQDNNYTLSGSRASIFYCDEVTNPRENKYGLSHKFYYLDEELYECKVKEQYTFNKLDKEQEE